MSSISAELWRSVQSSLQSTPNVHRSVPCRASYNFQQNAKQTSSFAPRESHRYGIFEGVGQSKDDAVQRTMQKFYEGRNGPPLRVLPIGGVGEIGMNCMLVGHYDRYIMIDAGLMFPDYEDFGMVKVLPDTTFISRWKHKIEAVIITHGHEDHIGALPWVLPVLDPSTPIFSTSFTLELIKKRLKDHNIPIDHRCRQFKMRKRFQAGPFSIEAVRVTHSIPDCCGLIIRCDDGTIFHSGDWKIDENPVDGETFDRKGLEELGKEGVTLLMSDSTNVLSPGRTVSETDVRKSILQHVLAAANARIITTQFASNIHRLGSMKAAADAAGRKLVFIGTALKTYMDAAWKDGKAPFDPSILVKAEDMGAYAPKDLLIVTTGSQGETRSALNLASFGSSRSLKLSKDDVILYSAKMIPGNETRVMKMLNRISEIGPNIVTGRDTNLHTSGHAFRDELQEMLQLVRPQHFLPVHGEYTFLKEHEQLGRASGIHHTKVIRNGEMLGVAPLRNGRVLSSGFASLGKENLQIMYNDGDKGFGTASELRIDERRHIAHDGIIIVSVEVIRDVSFGKEDHASRLDGSEYGLRARIRITTRCLWLDKGKLSETLNRAANAAVATCRQDADLQTVERTVATSLRKVAQKYNNKRPDVVVLAVERATGPRDDMIQKRLLVDAFAQLDFLVKNKAIDTKPKPLSMLTPKLERVTKEPVLLDVMASSPVQDDDSEEEETVAKQKVEEANEEERVKKAIAEKVLMEMRNARTQKAAKLDEEKQLEELRVASQGIGDSGDVQRSRASVTSSIAAMVVAEVSKSSHSRWKPEETQVLIRLRTSMDEKFKEAKLKTPLWKEISDQLAGHGYEHTHTQCKAMWATLVKRYRNLLEDEESDKSWPFFDPMHAYLSDDPDN